MNAPKKGLLEIVLVIIILIFALGILNFFNIIPLSSTFPNQLGFLPIKMDLKSQLTSTQINFSVLPIKMSCPSIPTFCQTGNGVIKDGHYIGWGGVLATGSAIFAAFDGVLSSTESTFPKEENGQITQKQFITAYLEDSDLRIRATYYFRGSISKAGFVTKGSQIAVSNGKRIVIYDDNSLIFFIISGYPDKNTLIPLSKQSFEQQ